MQATALVHEAYFRMADLHQASWNDRAHFFATAARTMRAFRWITRSHACEMHGGNLQQVDFEEALSVSSGSQVSLTRLDDSPTALAEFDESTARWKCAILGDRDRGGTGDLASKRQPGLGFGKSMAIARYVQGVTWIGSAGRQ